MDWKLFIWVYVFWKPAVSAYGLCDLEAAGFGFDDDPSYADNFTVYFKLSQDISHAIGGRPAKRGIHLGLLNISSCLLMAVLKSVQLLPP